MVRIHTIDSLGGNVYMVDSKIVLPRLIVVLVVKVSFLGNCLLFAKVMGMVVFCTFQQR